MYLKIYKNKYKMLSIWSKLCLPEPRGNHAWEAFMIKSKGYLLKISKAAHEKLSKSSPKHTFLRATRYGQTNKRHDASTVIYA